MSQSTDTHDPDVDAVESAVAVPDELEFAGDDVASSESAHGEFDDPEAVQS